MLDYVIDWFLQRKEKHPPVTKSEAGEYRCVEVDSANGSNFFAHANISVSATDSSNREQEQSKTSKSILSRFFNQS